MSLLGPDGLPVRSGSEELRDMLAVDPGRFHTGQVPNRTEKRAIRNSVRAYRVRAARARNRAASKAGVGTPAEGIERALARAGDAYSDADGNGKVLLPPAPYPQPLTPFPRRGREGRGGARKLSDA